MSKNCSIHHNNHEVFDSYNFWTPVDNNIPDLMFETETVEPCLVQKSKSGGTWPPASQYLSIKGYDCDEFIWSKKRFFKNQ